MNLELMKETTAQMAFVGSVVAGFAMTVVVQLLGVRRGRRRLRGLVVGLFLVAAIFFIIYTFVCVEIWRSTSRALLTGEAAFTPAYLRNLTAASQTMGLVGTPGLFALLGGLGLLGFLHSRAVGIVGVLCTLVAARFMFVVMVGL